MRQKEVLLIIPAYNEEKNIEKVMKQLAQPVLRLQIKSAFHRPS